MKRPIVALVAALAIGCSSHAPNQVDAAEVAILDSSRAVAWRLGGKVQPAKKADQRLRPSVIAILKSLGVLEDDGTYAGGGGGFANPATEDLNMDDHDLTGVLEIRPSGASLSISGHESNPALGSIEAQSDLNLNGNDLLDVETATFGGTATFSGAVQFGTVAITAGVGSPTALAATQAGKLITNTGTTVKAACTLPDSPTVGTFYDFLCDDTDGLRIVANTGQTITAGALGTSATAGYIETVRQESGLRLTYTASNVWRATRIEGTWRKDSTTSAGFAFTPTEWISWTPTSATWVANVTFSGLYMHEGWNITSQMRVKCSGAPSTASLTTNNWAGGFAPSATQWLQETSTPTNHYHEFFTGSVHDDSAGASRGAMAALNTDGTIYWGVNWMAASNFANITQASPYTFAADDFVIVRGTYAVD